MKRKIHATANDTISKDDTATDTPKVTTNNDESTEQCATKAEPPPHQRVKIILLGDSITQGSLSATLSGWGTYLADVYQRRADVYNRGFSGYNTDWFANYLETDHPLWTSVWRVSLTHRQRAYSTKDHMGKMMLS